MSELNSGAEIRRSIENNPGFKTGKLDVEDLTEEQRSFLIRRGLDLLDAEREEATA